MDLPGVTRDEIEIVFARNVLLIAGRKLPRAFDGDRAAFHVAERAFGRFGRAITLDGAFDTDAATAALANGELRLVLPRQAERRGAPIRIPVRTP
jgi:HSP20 family protein